MNRAATDHQVDTLRGEIAHTRAELGETVQELAARADVPARARESARRTADRLRGAGDEPRLWLAAAGGLLALVGLLIWARRNRRHRDPDQEGGPPPLERVSPRARAARDRVRGRVPRQAGPIERWKQGGRR